MVFGRESSEDTGLRRREERCTVRLLFVAHKGPSPAQTLQAPRVSSTKLRELRFSSQDLWERCLGGGRREGPCFLFGLISCHDHFKRFSVLPVSAKTMWLPRSSDFRPQSFYLASTLLLLFLILQGKENHFSCLPGHRPSSLLKKRNNFLSPGTFYLCISHGASPLVDGWGIARGLSPFVRTHFTMLLREQRVGFCVLVFFPPPQRERDMWLPTANLNNLNTNSSLLVPV